MKTPHKHAALIKAWADGAEIEKRVGNEWDKHEWCDIWAHDSEYRIKPTPKPDIVERFMAYAVQRPSAVEHWEKANLKLTFDGETGKLKSAQVI
jgi:hypothetical protein